jgi:hypothetical protein
MLTGSDVQSDAEAAHPHSPIPPTEVLRAVEEIIRSRLFRTSPQCQKLLRYVVSHTLEGREEELKERIIGCEVFGRPQNYNTSDDPVVRTRAADVRKRLAVFYQEEGAKAAIRITMPSGSYRVLLTSLGSSRDIGAATAASAVVAGWHPASQSEQLTEKAPEAATPQITPAQETESELQAGRRRLRWTRLAAPCALLLAIAAGILAVWSWTNHLRYHSFETFWAPLAGGSRPPIIYIGSSAVYRLTGNYIERYEAAHPTFKPDQNGREFTVPLAKGDVIDAGDLVPDERSFVTVGDVAAAVSITSMLADRKQPYDLRVGQDVVFGDFRTTPVILIGAFNNSWTIELSDTPCFSFGADNSIREAQGLRRVWRTVRDAQGVPHEDYALISRQISPKSGKFVFTVAGLDLTGTRAAAEFVRDPVRLDAALRKLPSGWQDKKLQLVLHTNVLDDIPSGTQVAASCVQ